MAKKRSNRRLPEAHLEPDSEKIHFSFKHMDADHPTYGVGGCSEEFFRELLKCLNEYSAYSVDQFCDQNNHDNRHTIDWDTTSEKQGFRSLEENLKLLSAWQFALCPRCKSKPRCLWRAYGFLSGNVFYLVWLDTEHKLSKNSGAKRR